VDRVLPVIEGSPEWLPLPATGNLTVAQRVAQIKNITDNFKAIQGVPADIYAPEWSLNAITSYDFAREARVLGIPLAGLSVGGNLTMRGPTIDGFAETSSAAILNPNAPYYASRYEIFGGMIGYSRKIFRQRIDWRLQLNVRNVFDAYTVRVLRTVDARDGTHRGVNAIYNLTEPRTYQLTSTFKF
jgi:outer membrane receptor protein involved in Fe transport